MKRKSAGVAAGFEHQGVITKRGNTVVVLTSQFGLDAEKLWQAMAQNRCVLSGKNPVERPAAIL